MAMRRWRRVGLTGLLVAMVAFSASRCGSSYWYCDVSYEKNGNSQKLSLDSNSLWAPFTGTASMVQQEKASDKNSATAMCESDVMKSLSPSLSGGLLVCSCQKSSAASAAQPSGVPLLK